MNLRRLLFILLLAVMIWTVITFYSAYSVSSKEPAQTSSGWLDGFLDHWNIFFGRRVSPEEISLVDASGYSYRCTGHYRYPLKTETSGLFYDRKNKRFYTVADKGDPQAYEFTISDRGIHIHASWRVTKQQNLDFEGIDLFHFLGARSLLIACEKTTVSNEGQVLKVDPASKEVSSILTVVLGKKKAARNTTFEGIAVDNRRKQIYLVKERHPMALYMLDHRGHLLGRMNQKALLGLFRQFADRRSITYRLDGPISASLSGLDFEEHTGILAILNRSHRNIVLTVNRAREGLDLEIIDILKYKIPEGSPYGNAEGIAVADFGRGRSLVLITDPGPGGRPTVTVFDYPGKRRAF